LTLGGKDEGPEGFFRVGRGRVGVDAAGNIHVLDSDANRVVVFDSIGRHLRTLGRPGQGPGELTFPVALHVTPDGHVTVLEVTKDGVMRWGPDGSVLPTVRVRAKGPPQSVAVVDGGAIYTWTDYGPDESPAALADAKRRMLLQRERGDSIEVLASLELAQPVMAQFAGCGILMRLPPLLSPELSWTMRGNRVAAISKVEYEITVQDGAKRMLVRRDVAPEPTTLEIARREVGDSMRVTGGTSRCAIPPEEVVKVRGYAPMVQAVRAVMLAPDGSLWAQRGGPSQDPAVIDRFDPKGNYLGTLAAGSPMPIAFMPNGDVVAAQKDKESDVDRLVVYRRK
jgi:DNA-binding beta-propeller fold protein YncE